MAEQPGVAAVGGAAARLRAAWPQRRPGFWGVLIAVLLAHLLLSKQLLEDRVGWGSGDKAPVRIEVAFVRELVAAEPPPVVVPVAVAERRLAAVAKQPQAAASAPALAASAAEPEPRPDRLALAPPPPPPQVTAPVLPPPLPAELAAPSASAVAELMPPLPPQIAQPEPPLIAQPVPPQPVAKAALPAASAASAVAFEWPPSTRLTYRLKGDYRGPVEGTASVEWLRQGSRYQVHLETSIGPVLSRHITSEGELTANGLAPRRFDGEQKVLFRAAKRWQLRFGPEKLVLADGKEVPMVAGAQDEASQFVQLTWLFTTQPERLKLGQSVEMPLAISRRLERWIYDVIAEETLRFGFGPVATFHLKPRTVGQGGDLTPEIWIAPSLQYLPVRILIRDNSGHWIDLSLDAPPMQAAPGK